MIQIKLIRHSERLDFTHPFYWLFCVGQYWADSPLTINGYTRAREKGAKLISDGFRPTHIYSSPYARTIATSSEIQSSFSNSEIVIEPLLSEFQPRFSDHTNIYPNGIPTICSDDEMTFSFPESRVNFIKRVKFIVYKLLNKQDSDFIMVSHGEVIKMFINYLQDKYPDIILEPGNTPYLTTLAFTFDKDKQEIIEHSIRLE